jgi:hypothetical protein
MNENDDNSFADAISSTASDANSGDGEMHIMIEDSSYNQAISIRASQDFAAWEAAQDDDSLGNMAGRLGSILQTTPSLLAAGEASGKRLMEVVVNGKLVRAADGNGFRAFTVGPKGVNEHARLFEADRLQNILNAGAVWQVASVIVAQKHLADISQKLDAIAKGVTGLSSFLNDERRARVEAAFRYLEQARITLEAGEISASMRMQLESCERDLLAIETHLQSEIARQIKTIVPHEETVGTEYLAMGISKKIREQEAPLRDLALCIRTRICAWHVLALFPGEPGLKEARRADLQRSVQDFAALSPAFDMQLSREIQNIQSKFNTEATIKRRRMALEGQLKGTTLKIRNTHSAAERMVVNTQELLLEHDAPVRILLQYHDGILQGARRAPA